MEPLGRSYDFAKIEAEIEAFWKKGKLAEKASAPNPEKPLFSWVEGPPTANAPPGLHHVEVRTFKDLNLRYQFMQGKSVPRKGGWDCHGLPVEVQVEKKLGLATKKAVVEYGIGKFNEMCRQDVFSFIKDWDRLTDKMAFWVDLENAYVTMKDDYIESVWWSLKEMYERKLLYEGHKVVPYCPRCETPLSSHEVALGYKDVKDPAITVKFKLKDQNRSVLAWTTTPWTLPSNVALAVNPAITYAVIASGGEEFIVAEELAAKHFPGEKPIELIAGEKLIGLAYEPLFPYFQNVFDGQKAYQILPADFVSTADGTGIVHIAPAFGEDDYQAAKAHGFAFIQPVRENGTFDDSVADFKGLFVKDADERIIIHLKEQGKVFKKEKYQHNYPFCWRCSTPLLYFATKSWFIRVSEHRDKILKYNDQIKWYPSHIKDGRFGKWLEGAKDWALSRKKFWGTPLPVWRCECGQERAIGSKKELRELGENVPKELELHKPMVDDILLACECGKKMRRVEDVIDCWYDSGCAPFAQFHYPFENKQRFEEAFPYDFITEAIDQTRGWFYTMHVIASLLFESPAYKSCLVAGHVVDDKGEKMSKSKGNIINPWEAFGKVGVDAVRLHFLASAPENPKRFGYDSLNESTVPFLLILWNSAYFASDFMARSKLDGKNPAALRLEDKWMLSATDRMVAEMTSGLNAHEYDKCISALRRLVMDDFSRWYIKLVRDRASQPDEALAFTFREVFGRIVRVLAPIAPYISDYLFRRFGGEGSVHFASWPSIGARDEALEAQMSLAQSATASALAAREKVGISVRWPLPELFIETRQEFSEDILAMVCEQANVKKVTVVEKFAHATLSAKPEPGKLGPIFGKKTPKVMQMLQSPDVAASLASTGTFSFEVDGERHSVSAEHFTLSYVVEPGFELMPLDSGAIFLSTVQSDELLGEGYARELTRRVQDLRKESGLSKDDRVELAIVVPQKGLVPPDVWDELREKVGATKMEVLVDKPAGRFDAEAEAKIRELTFFIFFQKIIVDRITK